MLAILIAIAGYFLLALVFILDKIILDKKLGKPVVYAFYSNIILLPLFLAIPFGVEILTGIELFWSILSGIAFGLAMWTMFIAVKKGETSHISPFVGAVIAIFTFIFSVLFLQEQLKTIQIIGIVLLAAASLILSFERSKKFNGFHIGFLWAVLAGILFAIAHVSAKYIFDQQPFWTGLVWTRGSVGFVGLLALLSPSVWKTFKPPKKKSKTKTHTLIIVTSAKFLSVGANLLIHYAIAIGSVTIVNALSGVQYVLMFIMIFVLSKWFSKIFKEYFTKRELIVQSIAIVLVSIGISLFVL